MTEEEFKKKYELSIKNPQSFWGEAAEKYVTWFKRWDIVATGEFQNTQWFINGKLNVCYNCLDRHLEKRSNQIALIWQGDDSTLHKKFTYAELHETVVRFARVLKKHGIKKGDRICIYLPMIPEAMIAMLACARIGAIHSVVFAGFSPESLKNRILDAKCCMVITANEGIRGDKVIPLKNNVDEALQHCPDVKKVIVVARTQSQTVMTEKDVWYHDELLSVKGESVPCEMMSSDDPFFILYTSGSTGKPKGILHATGGYLVYVAMTFKLIFDYQEGDIYWCTADVGWITGHSYLVYGPLCNGATTIMFEGVPNYPTPARFWEIIDQYQINIFYTAPTAIRALRREGDKWVKKTKRTSLKLLGTVGEPINPDVWTWYSDVVGNGKCPVVDTWWQTETGGILISPIPNATPLKPGSPTWPFFGITPKIVDDQGKEVREDQMGKLVITSAWPGMMQTVYGDRTRFESYFNEIPGCYVTGDNARCDKEGFYWITGRNDDVIKISGHRIGTGEVESAFLTDSEVAEVGVVAVPDEIKGENIYAFVTLKSGKKGSDTTKKRLIEKVRKEIGAIATPKYIQWTEGLPKTRSGKIMRRILRKIANNDLENLGDISTLADPQVVDALIKERKKIK